MFAFSEIQAFKTSFLKFWHPENERCGIVTVAGKIVKKVNRADDPTDNFEFRYEDLKSAVATWHTHPNKSINLSIADYWFFMQWPKMLHFVVSQDNASCYVVVDGTVRVIDEEEDCPPRILEEALCRAD